MEYTMQELKKANDALYDAFCDENLSPAQAAQAVRGYLSWPEELTVVRGLKALGAGEYTDGELLCLILLLDDILHDGLIPLQFLRFRRNKYYRQVLEGIEGLLSRGVLRYEGSSSIAPEKNDDRTERLYITPRALGLLFKGTPGMVSYKGIAHQAEIIPAATIPRKDLFFSGETAREAERLSRILDPRQLSAVMSRLQDMGRHPAVSVLLHGAPGTGKTELARQLARATGRCLLCADVSKLNASFHGDTEKNYRELFNSYRYLYALSEVEPILFLNEADAILCKRGDVFRQAIDKIEHRVQNLLLQEFEDFEGILIATTNLPENMDPAFGRRFLFKVEMGLPGPNVRMRIWRSAMPQLGSRDAQALASTYAFSGSQIDNVAARCGIEGALLGRELTLDEIRAFCDAEGPGTEVAQEAARAQSVPVRGSGIMS